MANYIGNPNIVSDGIYMTMKAIARLMPHAHFGGSISLVAHGLINRKVSDIDIVVPIDTQIPSEFLNAQHDVDNEIGSDTVREIDGTEIRRVGIKLYGIKICVFKVELSKIYGTVMKVKRHGSDFFDSFKIQDVNTTLYYKNLFSSSNPKHKKDMDDVRSRLKLLMSDDVLMHKAREFYDENMVGEPLYSDTILGDMVDFVKFIMKDETLTSNSQILDW